MAGLHGVGDHRSAANGESTRLSAMLAGRIENVLVRPALAAANPLSAERIMRPSVRNRELPLQQVYTIFMTANRQGW
ncbi:hypothetical protein MES4922_410018 [Mesorhizobium ventifaucium]|uniref:Uncharacterized protein n=1 Tax=Mesorhizobium ventifaucium TaxID=666020 RepID=A0ABN8K6L1_9HYPH|nr:hypothetical protein MES4922_410018 [Mesorhizobium ventifaucium]